MLQSNYRGLFGKCPFCEQDTLNNNKDIKLVLLAENTTTIAHIIGQYLNGYDNVNDNDNNLNK